MELREIVLFESAFLEEGHRQGISHGQGGVVLAVGAKPNGQASSWTEISRVTSLVLASEEFILPVIATTGTFIRLTNGRSCSTSCVSPLFEMAIKASRLASMPRSPCTPSAGCRKNEGVPVLASVAAIFWPMSPDLPMPEMTTFPWQSYRYVTAWANRPSKRAVKSSTARASISKTRLPSFTLGSTVASWAG